MTQFSSGCFRYASCGVVLRAACAAVPNGALAMLLHFLFSPDNEDESGFGAVGLGGISVLWSGYTFVLAFLIVFRSHQAYSRFWFVANTVAELRGSWFNAMSSLVSFCSADDDLFEEVEHFQYLIGRLCSMLYCAALQQTYRISDDSTLEILSVEGIDTAKLAYLSTSQHKCEVLVQWLQQLVVKNHRLGILEVPSTLLSRVFQELAHGTALLNRVRSPDHMILVSPYTQASTLMLTLHWIINPFVASQCLQSPWWAGILSFSVVAAVWGLMFVAWELDTTLGMELDCIPLQGNMRQFNESLLALVHPTTQSPPTYHPEQVLPHLDPLAQDDAPNDSASNFEQQGSSKARAEAVAAPVAIPEDSKLSLSGPKPEPRPDHATAPSPRPSSRSNQSHQELALSHPGNPVSRHDSRRKKRRSLAGRTKKNWTLATVAKMRERCHGGVENSLVTDDSIMDSSMLSSVDSNSTEPTHGTGSDFLTGSRNTESAWSQQATNVGSRARPMFSKDPNRDSSEIGVRC
eukprot:TRINITY_DN12817_c0_g1_i1.p1 TRINITY_DN12817_c0_g1~~TRINITY_DN12817_c0_g1_i1.p1  ORF type:complete len:519 (-),score=60.70 TRINITY_DN12817_c0_g1_i1:173-1729(-)